MSERRHTDLKYVVLIVDGAAGWPVEELGGLTSLQAARTPNLDALAKDGTLGLAHTIPEGMEPSSAIACMSVLGFDPAEHYRGRGPIEALALGIQLEPNQAALRCNLVTVVDGLMRSYSAGHISSPESHQLIAALNREIGSERVAFYPGVGFRHIVTVRDGVDIVNTVCTPPHDIHDQPVAEHLPRGPGGFFLQDLMDHSREILSDHPVNEARRERGELPATQIWLFWPGLQPDAMPSFAGTYGIEGALTSGVDLLEGLARQVSLEVLRIPGVTDGLDNDFAGQIAGSLQALEDHDLVVVHVEAPDEAGHSGDVAGKVEALEKVDELMVTQVLRRPDVRLLVLPDHPTPLATRTHTAEPVPFLIWGPGVKANGARGYSEAEASATGLEVSPGHSLLGRFLRAEF
ncbi:MAG: cofactor-independent phosphoglycerate mutase [Thermoleophilia bacterium]